MPMGARGVDYDVYIHDVCPSKSAHGRAFGGRGMGSVWDDNGHGNIHKYKN